MMSRLKRLFTLILSLTMLLPAIDVPAYASPQESFLQNWIVYEYNDTNGLPTGEANTVIQTSDGYIWIGSYGGLIRYDGTEFYNFSGGSGSFPSSGIRMLFEDSGGRLWIGTNDSGIYFYENNTFSHIEYSERTMFLSVRCFAEDKEGRVYAGTTSGLALISEDNTLIPVSGEEKPVYSAVSDENGVIWACKDDGIVDFVSDGKVIGVYDSSGLKSSVYCAGTDRSGNIYLGTSDNYIYGVELLDASYGDNSFKFTEHATDSVSTFNDIAQDAAGNIWAVGISGSGFFDSDWKWHSVKNEHAVAAVKICFDYEGNVWIASNSYGIIHLVEGTFYNVNSDAQLSEIPLNTICKYSGGYLLGTDTGLIALDGNCQRVENELTEMLHGERIRHIMRDSKGIVWISTYYQNGLVMYDPKTEKITAYSSEDGLADSQTRMTLEMSDGNIAVATRSGVSIIQNGKVIESYDDEYGLTVILCLCEGPDGVLYAGSDGQGLYAIKDKKVSHYNYEQGLDSGVVLRMLSDIDDKGLFISAGNSLYYWDYSLNRFWLISNYDKSPGSIFDMKLVGDDIWLMQSNGINIINREMLLKSDSNPAVKIVGITYGLTGSLNANTWNCEEDGVLYLCTANGMSILNISDISDSDSSISPVINNVEIDGSELGTVTSVSMKGTDMRLTFNFAALSFSGKAVKLRYMLEGFDSRYSLASNENPLSASYTNLRGGNYTFKVDVLASDEETVIGSLSIPVHKNDRFWEMPVFWVFAALVMIALIALVINMVVRKKTEALKKRQSEYRTIIMQALRTFANTIDAKDKYTNGHSIRVAMYSNMLAKKLGLSIDDQERLYDIALLHDIGKIGISDRILNKNGKLDPAEIEIVKQHPTIGGRILKDFTSIPGIGDGARYHHERYDGTGYNEGLKGDEIPYFARIICVADCYDTMAGGRHYQHSKTPEEIKEEFKRCSGTQFDPAIAEKMVELIDEGQVPVQFDGNEVLNFHNDDEAVNVTI
ncbi:MAG: HD domain-containing protein [Firmicutes bacterium]|nr:HD domain-containing protein [[Eubacterium] siraeum]MCM1488012.1 HD domain-containing protein [Bacillota bacterium]